MELAKFKSDYFALVAQQQEQQRLKEDDDAPNYEYIKNVLASYMMTVDVALQINLLRVIFVALKFSEQEQQRVKDAFNANHTSIKSTPHHFNFK